MRLRDDEDMIGWLIAVCGLLLVTVVGIVVVIWAGWRDEAGMAEVETMAEEISDSSRGFVDSLTYKTDEVYNPPEMEPRGWPADWPTRHDIGLIAWSMHHAQPEVDASSMAVERQASGEIVVTNMPEAPIADEAIRSIICDGRTWDCDTAMRVARCESNYNAHAVGRQGERGWFQIWAKWHMDRIGRLGYTVDDLFDPAANTAVAYDLWRADGWRHWSCAR